MPDHLTALDATFLELEELDPTAHMHIGGVLVFDPSADRAGAPPIEAIRETLAARLVELPRFRQRLSDRRTGGMHWPRWVHDEFFDIRRHVWAEELPAPAGADELRAWAGRWFSERLTRSRPLWEIVSLELGDGGWALASKTHHCMVDGVGSIDIVHTILDAEPDPPEAGAGPFFALGQAAPAPHEPTPPHGLRSVPGRVAGIGTATMEAAFGAGRGAIHLAARTAGAARHPRELAELAGRAEAVTELLIKSELLAAPATSLNGPIGPARRLAVTEASLSELKEITGALAGTINDVVLAATATALRGLLLARGEELPKHGIRAMVPVDVRSAAERLELGNEITSLFVELPLAPRDAMERYEAQVRRAESLKEGSQATGAKTLVDLSSQAPPVLHSFLARALYSTRLFNLTITNVPGPQVPLFAFGSRLRSVWPLVPLAAEHALGLAVFSYDGRLFFCFNADPRAVPELDAIAAATRDAIDELLVLARDGRGDAA